MSGTTPNEGFVYPLETDFADVQDFYNMAVEVDKKVRDYDAIFKALPRSLSFVYRNSADGSASSAGELGATFDVSEWDNTNGQLFGGWRQPAYDPPSYWLLGGDAICKVVTGTPVVTSHMEAAIFINNTDPVTGLSSDSTYRCKRTESNTAGEQITVSAIVKLWSATFSFEVTKSGGSDTQAIAAGSRMWGFRLGTAS